jgi:cell division protein ZapA
MAQVSVWINGYSYLVGCEDGQESHLEAMASVLQKRVNDVKSLGQQGEARVLLLAALLLADDLHDKEMALASSQAGLMTATPAEPVTVIDPEFDATVHRLAAKAEEIADALERA